MVNILGYCMKTLILSIWHGQGVDRCCQIGIIIKNKFPLFLSIYLSLGNAALLVPAVIIKTSFLEG
jgi:hypothetical protein